MKKLLAAMLVVVLLFTVSIPRQTANADGLTLSMLSGAAYAIAQSSGLSFTIASGGSSQSWMENAINHWLKGRSIAEVFGNEIIRLEVGKLVIPFQVANSIKTFLGDLIEDYGIEEGNATGKTLTFGQFEGQNVYEWYAQSTTRSVGEYYMAVLPNAVTTSPTGVGYEVVGVDGSLTLSVYYNGTRLGGISDNIKYPATNDAKESEYRWGFTVNSSSQIIIELCRRTLTYSNNAYSYRNNGYSIGQTLTGSNVTGKIPGTYDELQDLNDLQEWKGDVSGAPDTNLDDLLDDIFDQVDDGTLSVSGEIVTDVPFVTPEPTAVPTTAPTTLDDIGEAVGDIAGSLEGVAEGIDSLTGTVEGIQEALEVPTASEAPSFKFDLTTLFPFCIPFDIYRFVTMFSASPVAPHVQIPFNIPAINLNYTFDLDFSSFDSVASVLRSVELIAFCVGLAILTSKVIRW